MTQPDAQADRLAVQDVIVCYANSIDDRDFETYRGCFWPEISFEGFAPEPIQGVDAWLAFVEKSLAPYAQTQHLLGPPRIQIDGEVAYMRTDLQASHFYREPEGRIFTLWGAYRTILGRSEGSWRMNAHRLDVWSTRRD